MTGQPTKKVAFVDAGRHPEIIEMVLPLIAARYHLERTDDYDADYVFHSCRGYDVLKYSGVRIFVTGENVSPNFNISDYALAFDKMDFGDRYCWLPLIKLYRESYARLLLPRKPVDEVVAGKEGFCAYVMSNLKDSAEERTKIFDLLSAYKPVHSGGKWRNNVGGPVADKLAFQSKYKFVIAFENSSTPGYLTEKFAHAAESNAIPIYWGDPTIGSIFNPKAFVNCHDFPSLEDVVERAKEIDANDTLYREMLAEPWFPGGVEPECLRNETFVRFFSNIFDTPHEQAFRRNRSRWGIKQERLLFRMYKKPHEHGIRMLHKYLLELCRRKSQRGNP
ncbi:MAG: hypothetical protein K9M54_05660 [Kiritimatiellales bacterium]|nr:hypothetical protein [Kiritimatiellales bacterium]MCF7863323.1 hypothetical protein [Kiritimatiellales bacterium]